MIIGNGFLARAFESYRDNVDICIFASGVSNSRNTDMSLYERERNLLEQTITENTDKLLVYFSTCSIYDESLAESLYVQHKLAMENIIQNAGNRYIIFRKSNIIGDTDELDSLMGYLVKHIKTKQPFTIWKYATRNLIDIDDLYNLVDYILYKNIMGNNIVNIANIENYTVLNIVHSIEDILQTQGIYDLVNVGGSPKINVTEIQPLFELCGVSFGKGYTEKMIRKYYI